MPEPPKPKKPFERLTGFFKGIGKQKNPKHIVDTTGFDTVKVLDSIIEHHSEFRRVHTIDDPSLNGLVMTTHTIAEYISEIKNTSTDFDINAFEDTNLTIITTEGQKKIQFVDFFKLLLHGEIDILQYFSDENQTTITAMVFALEICKKNHGNIPKFKTIIKHYKIRQLLCKAIQKSNDFNERFRLGLNYFVRLGTDKSKTILLERTFASYSIEDKKTLISEITNYLKGDKPITQNTIDDILTNSKKIIDKRKADALATQTRQQAINIPTDEEHAIQINMPDKFDSEVRRAIPNVTIVRTIEGYTAYQKQRMLELFIAANEPRKKQMFWDTVKAYYTNPERTIRILESVLR